MFPGERPNISRAASPTAKTLLRALSIATTEGSFKTTPLPLTNTRILAVPKSIPISMLLNISFISCLIHPRAQCQRPNSSTFLQYLRSHGQYGVNRQCEFHLQLQDLPKS